MKVEELPSIHSGLRLGLMLMMVLMIISSSVVMLSNPMHVLAYRSITNASSNSSSYATLPMSEESSPSMSSLATPTTQAALQIPRTLQSNDLVNSLGFYEVTFITSTTGAIDRIRVDFPAGTNIAAAGVIERVGIGGGTLLKAGSSVTYDVTTPMNIPAGTFIRLEMFGIKNPNNPSTTFTATITTRDNGGNLIDGPSVTNVYTIKQIGSNDVAESFMKRGRAIDNAAGNAAGWNPNGVTTTFTISEPAVLSYTDAFIVIEVVQTVGAANHFCDTVTHTSGSFTIICSTPPPNASDLNYVIFNLPPHLIV